MNEPFFNHSSDVVFTAQEGGIAYLSCEVMIMVMIVMPVTTMATMMVMMDFTANEGRIAYLSCEVMMLMMTSTTTTMLMMVMAALPSCSVRCFFSKLETR